MRKQAKILCVILVSVIVCTWAWYFTPKTFLKGISPSEISRITVFDGTNGRGFNVKESGEIEKIVTAIQSVKMRRNGVSTGYSGFALRLAFIDENGYIIDNFILNGDMVIRDDPFFYDCSGGLGFDYLKELEDVYINRGEALK